MSLSSSYALETGWKLVLEDMGVSDERLMRRAGLPEGLMSQTPCRLSVADYHALWRSLEAEAGEEPIPLRFIQNISSEALNAPIFAALCSPDLESAAERIARYKALVGPMRLSIEDDDDAVHLTCTWLCPEEPPQALGIAEMLFWVGMARLGTRAQILPQRITFKDAPEDLEPYRAYLGVTPERGDRWSVSFAREDTTRPFLTANEGTWRVFEAVLQHQLRELSEDATVSERVRDALLELLPAGDASLSRLAPRLSMGKRTLQRRLSEEGTTYQHVLAQTRESLARHYLRHTEFSLLEISYLLGYDDPNSFHRAFQAWTGTTPESVRSRT